MVEPSEGAWQEAKGGEYEELDGARAPRQNVGHLMVTLVTALIFDN